jgi:ribosome-associated toxin RatA of RatAB toxin-antitoxin module
MSRYLCCHTEFKNKASLTINQSKTTMDYISSWWGGSADQQQQQQQQPSATSGSGGASEKRIIHSTIEQAMKVITDYEKYPEFLDGCNSTKIVSVTNNGKSVEVHWNVSVSIKTVEYNLILTENEDGKGITWTIAENNGGPFVKNVGGWILKETEKEGEIEATYFVDIELNIWVPGFLKDWVLSIGLPATLNSFKDRIEGGK